MTDQLIMLLSTDWFFPYWAEIGIVIREDKRIGIQQGCRELVRRILHGASSLFLIDFSLERRKETDFGFLALLRACDAESEVLATWEEWAKLTHEELSKSWTCSHLNQRLSVGDVPTGIPPLDATVRREVIELWNKYAVKPSLFRDVSKNSTTDWDVYIRSLSGKPEFLPSQLRKVLLSQRLRPFWANVRERLTPPQIQQLVRWYQAMITSLFRQDRPDLIPSYIS